MAELRTPQGHTLLLPEGCVSIGADPTNEVPVAAHLGLAPVHFRLQPWEGGHFLEDAGSGLGTLVNGHPVNWKPLTPGDVIVAGELEVVYAQQSKAASSPIPVIMAPDAPAGLMAAFPPPAPPSAQPPLPPTTPGSARSAVLLPPQSPIPGLIPPHPVPARPEFSPAPLANLPPVAAFAPPAWLPEDLLPESYRALPALAAPLLLPPAAPEENSPTILPPAPAPRRTGRRVLRWAAVLGLLTWAGHSAWQGGHLTPLLNSLRKATHRAVPSPPPAASPPFILTPDALPSPLSPPPTQAAETGTSTVPPNPGAPPRPRITSQVER